MLLFLTQWIIDLTEKVNCLEPHPTIPVLATSGLDDDVKIWLPKGSGEPNVNEWEKVSGAIGDNRLKRYESYFTDG